jgi:hypothetical protein
METWSKSLRRHVSSISGDASVSTNFLPGSTYNTYLRKTQKSEPAKTPAMNGWNTD